ncbi:uncharacterized protein LOC126843897 [Adelges cooleyi]|uniref:uncharacterized protein LOC126843897 n=1 Tax=Adelges cooleyi TaxID=133065 RepID=UPI00218067BB|nr:uncharacterized protein LOC126843897 [Adelges cooleyi]XP_050437656.1 uncharacterized protein LOC126843897 [Adelges cooleyi]XP_050437657.1 uncharacterized protein LOC126843897 [Adelges cooleyi]
MKLFCVLMPFAFVNVLALTETDYKKQVYISNYFFESIQRYGTNVDESVRTLIRSNISITSLALMLAAPENADTDEDDLQQLIDDEKKIQNRIRYDHEVVDCNVSGINFNNKSLTSMGWTRRSITKPSLKRLLVGVERGYQTQFDTQQTCRLIALLVIAKDPIKRITFTIAIAVDGYRDCHLTDNFSVEEIYRKFSDGFWKVLKSNHNVKIYKLT